MGCGTSRFQNRSPTDKNPGMSDMLEIHGMCKGEEQTVICKKGTNIKKFREQFQKGLSVKGVGIPKPVKFDRYDDKVKEYEPMADGKTLEVGMQFRALMEDNDEIPSVSPVYLNVSSGHNSPLNSISDAILPYKPPNITPKTTYRLWSLASTEGGRFAKRDPDNGNVKCDGISGDENTYVTTKFKSLELDSDKRDLENRHNCFAFLFNHADEKYVLKGNGDGKEVTTEQEDEIDDNSDVFIPEYQGRYTMLRQFGTRSYLGCDHAGRTTLMTNSDWSQHPHTLFIPVIVGNSGDN